MKRTEIDRTERDYDVLQREASRLGISTGEYLRLAVQGKLAEMDRAPWMRYAGLVASGDAQSSRSIDDVVYGGRG